MYKYIEMYRKEALKKRPGFNPNSFGTDTEKYIDYLKMSDFIALYTYYIDTKYTKENIKLNSFLITLFTDYIKSLNVYPFYDVIDNIEDIINDREIYIRYRNRFLLMINLYLYKYGYKNTDLTMNIHKY